MCQMPIEKEEKKRDCKKRGSRPADENIPWAVFYEEQVFVGDGAYKRLIDDVTTKRKRSFSSKQS